ncbi:MAG: PadR family transcriptional regulator [Cyanobacteriota bacterium]|nr:PadR family transcriptional regulator [Cyanobacteriota bacterium]
MALTHAILATLARSPLSGYDLAKHFDQYVACYWQASQQQIYRELAKLEVEGWVHSHLEIQADRPNKKVYEITPLGKENLKEWLKEPSQPTVLREDLLVKVLAGYLVPKNLIEEELKRRQKIHQNQLDHYRQVEQSFFANLRQVPLEHQFQYLTLKRGIRYEADWIAWCEEALTLLAQFPEECSRERAD